MTIKLTPKQLRAVTLLAQGETGRDVAKSVGVVPQTLSDWRRNPSFEALLNRLKLEALESARDKLQAASGTAVDTLVHIAKNAKNMETRRKAALDILAMTGYAPNTQELFAWGIGQTGEPEAKHSPEVDKMLQKMMAG